MATPMDQDVVVLGSANLDIVLEVPAFPAPGETILATASRRHPGGKGLNQAVAAGRAGASTAMVGAVGDDEAGTMLLGTLRSAGVSTACVRTQSARSGTATILLSPAGENLIVVDPGANADVAVDADAAAAVAAAAVLVGQLEIPLGVFVSAARLLRSSGGTVLLNAAPAQPVSADVLSLVDILVVNEHECAALCGDRAPPAAATVLARHVRRGVVVTLGERGAAYVPRDGEAVTVPGVPARVVDTTGAGDAFVGSAAAALAAGRSLPDALREGVVAGALAVETAGAVPSMPSRAQIDARLRVLAG